MRSALSPIFAEKKLTDNESGLGAVDFCSLPIYPSK